MMHPAKAGAFNNIDAITLYMNRDNKQEKILYKFFGIFILPSCKNVLFPFIL